MKILVDDPLRIAFLIDSSELISNFIGEEFKVNMLEINCWDGDDVTSKSSSENSWAEEKNHFLCGFDEGDLAIDGLSSMVTNLLKEPDFFKTEGGLVWEVEWSWPCRGFAGGDHETVGAKDNAGCFITKL